MALRSKSEVAKKAVINPQTMVEPQYQAPKHYRDRDMELDAIERLKSNITMLDDLHQRLGFMNSELESILGKRKK